MYIYLVRHGESQANVDKTLHLKLPDHEIALSSRGQEQAKEAGRNLSKELVRNIPSSITLWNSPYRRTRETSNFIIDNLNEDYKNIITRRESIYFCEQNFGVFDGLEDDEIEKEFPKEFKTWNLCKKFNGKFFARFPSGESPLDTAVRVAIGFNQIKDFHSQGIHIVVAHGTVIKLFEMMWFNHSPEWFYEAKTIGNCGIQVIKDNIEWNVFPGYKDGKLIT